MDYLQKETKRIYEAAKEQPDIFNDRLKMLIGIDSQRNEGVKTSLTNLYKKGNFETVNFFLNNTNILNDGK